MICLCLADLHIYDLDSAVRIHVLSRCTKLNIIGNSLDGREEEDVYGLPRVAGTVAQRLILHDWLVYSNCIMHVDL